VNDTAAVLVALGLLLGNAFFVGAEFALISARRTQIEPRAAAGSRLARTTLKAMENVSLMMAGAQLGITVCSLGLGAIGEPAVAHLIEGPMESAGVPEALVHPVAFAIALTVVVFLHMVLGEMVPKNIALAGPERSAMLLGPVLYAVVTVLRPLIWLLNRGANLVLRAVKVQARDEVASAFNREEVAGFVAQSRREGLLDDDEHDLLTGALEFGDRPAAQVTIPLAELVTVDAGAAVAELEDLCASTGYSRFPVIGAGGQMLGYVHVKDLLGLPAEQRERPVEKTLVRPLVTVSTSTDLREALRRLQLAGAHLARVVEDGVGRGDVRADGSDGADEQLVGVATLEDVIEELVGEVRDATQQPT